MTHRSQYLNSAVHFDLVSGQQQVRCALAQWPNMMCRKCIDVFAAYVAVEPVSRAFSLCSAASFECAQMQSTDLIAAFASEPVWKSLRFYYGGCALARRKRTNPRNTNKFGVSTCHHTTGCSFPCREIDRPVVPNLAFCFTS